ncbi:MAG: DUF5801 repeats-in-toxin domain-containing protein [Methylovirgula sp.]
MSSGTAYALSIGNNGNAIATGLTDTLTGSAITLSKVSATEIEGKDTNGNVVFKISVDQTGNVTFELDRPVENNSGPVTLLANSVMLTQTITDGDGSKASDSIDISKQFSISDDTPTITLTQATEPTLTVHEADLQASTNGGVNGTLHDGSTSTSPTSFAGAFSDHFGADGAAQTGSVSYALTVGNGGVTDLTDTRSGSSVTLHQIGATEIDGKDANGDLVFTLKVDSSGEVTFTLDRAVENNSGPVRLPSSSVVLTQTITDGDGTTASQNLDISQQFSITDDKPTITSTIVGEPVLTVHEADLTASTNGVSGTVGNGETSTGPIGFSNQFTDNFGADGAAKTGAVGYALTVGNGGATNLTDTQSGSAVTLHQSGTAEIDGRDGNGDLVFTIKVDSSGDVTFTLDRAVDNNGTTASLMPSDSVVLTQTIEDGDGTKSTPTSINIGSQLQITDDAPTMTSFSNAAGMPLGASGIAVDAANPSVSGAWVGSFGADGPNSATPFNLVMGPAPAGFTYSIVQSNITVDGHAGGFEEKVTHGSSSFTFFAFTEAVTVNGVAGEEMFAFAGQGGATPFFELTVFDNQTYTFHLDTTTLPTPATTVNFSGLDGARGNGSDKFLDFVNGGGNVQLNFAKWFRSTDLREH